MKPMNAVKFHLLCIGMLLTCQWSYSQDSGNAIVQTAAGPVAGMITKPGSIYVFKGVPYAAAPVGEKRWKAPEPLAHWTAVRQCTAFAASAMQPSPEPFYLWSKEFMAPLEPLSEDCLYLNIWSPGIAGKRPVIVWIHGGGFTGGAGAVPVYDGEALAQKGIVLVTINYRLGIFGFLAHPSLTEEADYHASGNYGLLDQVAALQWIQKNISAFGGDSANITIAGQSAGAFSISALMASPLCKGLFQKVIAHSGGMFGTNSRAIPLATAEQAGLRFAEKLHVSSINELRALSAAEVLAVGADISSPVIDGYLLPAGISAIFKAGKQDDLPLLTGWNKDEGFAPQVPLTAERFKQRIENKFGTLATDFLKAYPSGSDEEAKRSQQDMSRDEIFAWQNYTWAILQTSTGNNKVWLYQFSQRPPGLPDNGAFHSSEIAYALHTLNKWDRPWTNADKKLETIMSDYWVNFAATGNPNGNNLPVWLPVEKDKVQCIELKTNCKMIKNPLREQMEAWNKYQGIISSSKNRE